MPCRQTDADKNITILLERLNRLRLQRRDNDLPETESLSEQLGKRCSFAQLAVDQGRTGMDTTNTIIVFPSRILFEQREETCEERDVWKLIWKVERCVHLFRSLLSILPYAACVVPAS